MTVSPTARHYPPGGTTLEDKVQIQWRDAGPQI